jgi:transcriptional regulator GlxA family with amidase domain
MKTRIFFLAIVTLTSAGRELSAQSMFVKHPMNVAIFIYDGVELQDFAGPGEVFTSASNDSGMLFNVYTVATSSREIISQTFLKVTPNYTIDNCPKPDIIVIPGGDVKAPMNDDKLFEWLQRSGNANAYYMSVCTGAFLLAKSGKLDGKIATTHYCCPDQLAKSYPKVKVVKDERFTDNGKVLTTEGVSAGIDGSLYLVQKLFGKTIAENDARYMMYNWKPDQLNEVVNE